MKRYQKQVQVLESDKLSLQRENEELRSKLSGVLNSSSRLRKLNGLEEEVSALRKKVDGSSLRLGRDAEMKRLQNEILSLKAQKVESQRKMKEESVQFRLCKALLEKEVLQLKENERKKDHIMNTLLVLNQRMKAVMQRKMEEASMSRKRLKEFLKFGKAASNGKSCTGGVKGAINQEPLTQGSEDIEAQAQINGFCSEYDRQMKEMMKEIAGLKRQEELSKQHSPGCIEKGEEIRNLLQDVEANHKDKDTEIRRLKEEVAKLSDLVKQLEMQKAEHISASNLKESQNSTAVEDSKEDAGMSKESRSSVTSNHLGNSGVSSEAKHSSHSGGITGSITKTSSSLACCSCSNQSSCKTNKCKCRESGASCGTSCGCSSKKCSNRDAASVKLDKSPVPDVPTGVNSSGSAVMVEETTVLAAHGAMLLQDALLAKPAQISDNNESRRKPLSDIGNKIKGDAPKPSRKKKNQKSKGHPAAAPLPPFQQDDSNTPELSDITTTTGDMGAPKFIRTTRSTASK